MNNEKRAPANFGNMSTALAILIAVAAMFFAGVMYGKYGAVKVAAPPSQGEGDVVAPPEGVTPDLSVLAIQKTDAVRGSGDVVLIEYSDYECPFCQRFHPTAQALVDNGEVAWVYRHLPLPFHPTAKDGAVIGECVKQHRGANAFWQYTDGVFAIKDGFSVDAYKKLATTQGLSGGQIDSCLASGSAAQKIVDQHMNDAQTMGVNGTPGSFLVNTKTDEVRSIPGALPIEQVRDILASIQ